MAETLTLSALIRPCVRAIKPYVAGKSPQAAQGRRVKLASNENRLGSSPLAIEAVSKALKNGLSEYNDSHQSALKDAVVNFWKKNGVNFSNDRLVFGDGSGEVLSLLLNTLVNENETVVFPEKSFILYSLQSGIRNARIIESPRKGFNIDCDALTADALSHHAKLVILANPDNPTSGFISKAGIRDMMTKIPESTIVLLDEAYIHFAGIENSALDLIDTFPNLIITHTFSKAYGLAALRVGYAVAHTDIATEAEKIRLPFNLGLLQQEGAIAALKDDDFLDKTLKHNQKASKRLQQELENLGFHIPVRPFGNFLFVDLGEKFAQCYNVLESAGITVRNLESFGFGSRFARITVGTDEDNEYLLAILKKHYER